jgi:competence protein ComEC
VEAGNRINIEKNLFFDILWPSKNETVSKNVINNNALVCKMVSKKVTMLFTGDIEQEAEKAILNKYKSNIGILKSDILKVAHHGSKTSSTKEFLEAVKPNTAVIGVGKNNNFGHPNKSVLERLKRLGCRIYRTDESGEIILL